MTASVSTFLEISFRLVWIQVASDVFAKCRYNYVFYKILIYCADQNSISSMVSSHPFNLHAVIKTRISFNNQNETKKISNKYQQFEAREKKPGVLDH